MVFIRLSYYFVVGNKEQVGKKVATVAGEGRLNVDKKRKVVDNVREVEKSSASLSSKPSMIERVRAQQKRFLGM